MTITEFQGKYRPLSNFWYVAVRMPKIATNVFTTNDPYIYRTTEHAYQAAKTMYMPERLAIYKAENPGEAKHLGRSITLRNDWDAIKLDVMLDLLRQKFTNRGDLKRLLLSTGDQELIEGNRWHDNFWGICSCAVCQNDIHVIGQNHLGMLLMQVRGELQESA